MNERDHCIANTHSWEAGMMHVHVEDVATVAAMRKVECGRCEDVYPSARPCPEAGATLLESYGFLVAEDGSWTWEELL